MLLERKYPLLHNIPYDDGWGTFSDYSKSSDSKINGFRTKDESMGLEGISADFKIPEYKYIATDGNFIYRLDKKGISTEYRSLHKKEASIKVSNFEGCPHYYGTMFLPNGDIYELQCKITKEYLNEAHQIRGDWNGYKEGDWTTRFLNKTSLLSAYELFKIMI